MEIFRLCAFDEAELPSEAFDALLEVMVCSHLSVLVQRNFAVHTHTHTRAQGPCSSGVLALLPGLEELTQLPQVEEETPPVCISTCRPVLTPPPPAPLSVVVCPPPPPPFFHEPMFFF